MSGETTLVDEETRHYFGIERMNALTDGVFAIVLTLLVLELKLPERDESILTLMADDWHVFVAWIISFAAIARFWLVHHQICAAMKFAHNHTLQLNFAVLGAVSLVPFSADIIGSESIEEPWSTVVFAINIGLLSLTIGLLARHGERAQHLFHGDTELLPRVVQHRKVHLYLLPTITAAAAALAFVHPYLAIGLLAAEFILFGWFARTD